MKLCRYFLIIAVILTFIPKSSVCEDIQTKADEVLQRFQLRDGQTVEWLVELGPDAVPVLAEKLGTYKFPGAILDALAELKDKRATLPLTEYLYKHEPFSSTLGEYSAERNMALRTLREIEDQRAEAPLMSIVRSEGTLLKTRLLASAAVARFGTAPAKEECQKFIMNIWHISSDSDKELTVPHYNSMTVWSAVREAMLEVDTREAIGIVSSFLKKDDSEPLYQKEIISAFIRKQKRKSTLAGKQKSEMLSALHKFCTDETQRPFVRLYCIESLWKAGMSSTVQVNDYLNKLSKAEPDSKIQNSVRSLKEKIASGQ